MPFSHGQDSSLRFIMPYETNRLFLDQIMDYQAYYANEISICNEERKATLEILDSLHSLRKSRKIKRAILSLKETESYQDSIGQELQFYLDAWLEIESFYQTTKTQDFISTFNPTACYQIYTLYDTLLVSKDLIQFRKKDKLGWKEFPEPLDAEWIEDVEVLKPASTVWEKRKSERPCNSPDPEDCLVWCRVDVPAEVNVLSRTFRILECPLGYEVSTDLNHCEKEVNFQGGSMDADPEMAAYIPTLDLEVEIMDWEILHCKELDSK
ncbi:MAG: hypothetical protein HKN16_10375 [Saprospiraceae bacterium]|nr:hypothetical protein [Saprospiraceae bacterium]